MEFTCERCGKIKNVRPSQVGRFCSRECYRLGIEGKCGPDNPNWRGGRFVRDDGYVAVRHNNKYVLEHRLVMEKHLGRELGPHEHVHHRNEDKTDNRLENLELLEIAEHTRTHHKGKVKSKWGEFECCGCGRSVERLLSAAADHPNVFCTMKCYRTSGWTAKHGERVAEGRRRAEDGTFV